MLYVVGTGPGDGRYAFPEAAETVSRCGVVAGYPNTLGIFSLEGKGVIDLSGTASSGPGLVKGLEEAVYLSREEDVCILVSGDPGFFSLLSTVRNRYPDVPFKVIPGITSFQAACAALGIPWQDFRILSLHHPGCDGIDELKRLAEADPGKGIILLTGPDAGPAEAAAVFKRLGQEAREAVFCMDVGTGGERYERMRIGEAAARGNWGRLCTVIVFPGGYGEEGRE